MLIIYSLAITFLIFCFFNLIGKFFINKKKKDDTSKTIIFGYSIFLIFNYNLYFLIYLDLSNIILLSDFSFASCKDKRLEELLFLNLSLVVA